jgi:8-oxo-dGTP pyrophosphatase MutT (NUDIX family)
MEPEWGFPKGRRNYNEKDIDCALREFSEETGYSKYSLKNIENIQQFRRNIYGVQL